MKHLIVVLALLVAGCSDNRNVVGTSDDIPVWAGGNIETTPDFCEALKPIYPNLQCLSATRFSIDEDEFEMLTEPPSERELVNVISPSASGNYAGDAIIGQCNPDLRSCWLVRVVDSYWPPRWHYELRCISNGCIPSPT